MAEDIIKALVVKDQLERVEGRNENVTYNLPKDYERKLEDARNQQEFDRAAKIDADRIATRADQERLNRENNAAGKKQYERDMQAKKDRETFLRNNQKSIDLRKSQRDKQIQADKDMKAANLKRNIDAKREFEQARRQERLDLKARLMQEQAANTEARERERSRIKNASSASERARLRSQMDANELARKRARDKRIPKEPSRPLNMDTIKNSIKSTARKINVAGRSKLDMFGGSLLDTGKGIMGAGADAIYGNPTQNEINRNFNQESKHLSAAFRNKQIGKKNPINDVIGVSGTVRRQYVTDGHGRSGKRATLEWRRANRQYASPERAAAASINENWMSSIMGTTPEPVRHRKVKAKDRGLSPLERFNRLI